MRRGGWAESGGGRGELRVSGRRNHRGEVGRSYWSFCRAEVNFEVCGGIEGEGGRFLFVSFFESVYPAPRIEGAGFGSLFIIIGFVVVYFINCSLGDPT